METDIITTVWTTFGDEYITYPNGDHKDKYPSPFWELAGGNIEFICGIQIAHKISRPGLGVAGLRLELCEVECT